ncbi:hypothetical protein OAT16_05260 [Prolixibacteraceae bacterium]|nr:hypothetical protein [Prolixibacteraceae bacterium]
MEEEIYHLFCICFQYGVQMWYVELISNGKYLVFKSGISSDAELQNKMLTNAALLGALGGAFAGAKLATLRFVYMVNK